MIRKFEDSVGELTCQRSNCLAWSLFDHQVPDKLVESMPAQVKEEHQSRSIHTVCLKCLQSNNNAVFGGLRGTVATPHVLLSIWDLNPDTANAAEEKKVAAKAWQTSITGFFGTGVWEKERAATCNIYCDHWWKVTSRPSRLQFACWCSDNRSSEHSRNRYQIGKETLYLTFYLSAYVQVLLRTLVPELFVVVVVIGMSSLRPGPLPLVLI